MNRRGRDDRTRLIACLVEGNSIRSTVRMTGIAKNTIAKLLVDVGAACTEYQDKSFRNLKCQRVQVDEIWSFVGCKPKSVEKKKDKSRYAGDIWTWVALDADTKLVPCWMLGPRDAQTAAVFIEDLAVRTLNKMQLTSDGFKVYLTGDINFFGELGVDYGQLVKMYGSPAQEEQHYSPAICIASKPTGLIGNPDPEHISTSYVERQNRTMRMSISRFTRLTDAFNKKLENHMAAVALHFMYYNFVRIHQTLRVTPAMAAGVTTRLWSVADIATLLDMK